MQQVTHEQIYERLDEGDGRFSAMERDIADLKQSMSCLHDIKDDMAFVRDGIEAARGIVTLGKVCVAISKPILAIGSVIGLIWAFFKFGVIAVIRGA